MGATGVGPVPTTIEEAGRRAGRGLWIAAHGMDLAGRAARLAPEPACRAALGVASRRHGGHAVAWRSLVPALPHLDVGELVEGSAAPLEAWLAGALGDGGDDPEVLVALHEVLVAEALVVFDAWAERSSAWTDGPERRVLDVVRRDLRALGTADACAPTGGAAARAGAWRTGLEQVGGLVVGVAAT